MPNMRDLRRRIKSVKSTQQITKAMKAVSAAKMRRAQDAVTAARPYSRRIRELLGRVAPSVSGFKHPLLEVREPKKVAYILVTADRGLCGGFNSNVIRRMTQEAKGRGRESVSLIAVGRKGRDFFLRRGYTIAGEYVHLGENIGMGQAHRIARFVIDQYGAAEFDEVYLVYSRFVNVLVQKPTVVKLLPAEPPAGDDGAKVDYILEPSAEAVLMDLLPRYVETAVFAALLESKAGEHSARMTAMDSATKNADEMVQRLTLTMNRIRQAVITKEISEIVGGSAALE
ncbi:MAG: ATP synthase F1 subunit gamma [Peptococcaceae bacterium]|jgi:F-type H+-transporting ATPase subunit gamma|nr:ATP synthase F1 subunit gamma [Peptococcaceae bacterium]